MPCCIGVSLALKEVNKAAFSWINHHLASDNPASQLHQAVFVLGESQEWLLLPIGPQSPLTISKCCSIWQSLYILRDSVGLGLYGHPIYKLALVQSPTCVMLEKEKKPTLHPEDLPAARDHN